MRVPVLPEDQLEPLAILVPDRADAPISEITERFFRALLIRVPLARIEEVHLFSPLRQRGVETGIAVVAAREIVLEPVSDDALLPLLLDERAPETSDQPIKGSESLKIKGSESLIAEPEASLASERADVGDGLSAATTPVETTVAEHAVDDSPYADDPTSDYAARVPAGEVQQTAPVIRHTVYTARYRLVQKGADRGKWEFTVVAEAEAPLITVEMVVRGVQRRAGEESETTRYSAAQIARALRLDLRIA